VYHIGLAWDAIAKYFLCYFCFFQNSNVRFCGKKGVKAGFINQPALNKISAYDTFIFRVCIRALSSAG
jgi:hypothetical protein